jgi:hypothetical protein
MKTAKQFNDEIGLKEEINNNSNSGDDELQEFDHDDNSATHSEEIPVILVAI